MTDHGDLAGHAKSASTILKQQELWNRARERADPCAAGAGAWVALGSAAAWLSSPSTKLKISEPTTDLGFIHIEMELSLPSSVITDGRLGMGFVRSNTAGAISQERLPSNDVGGPIADNVYSWSTVELAMPTRTTGMEPTMVSVARPDRAQLLRVR